MGGWNSEERSHKVMCHVMSSHWSVTFADYEAQTPIGPWVICDTHEEVVKILLWGHISDLDEHYRNIDRWGVGGGLLHLTTKQRHQLIARRQGWPWNGYELQKMKEAGRYPPQRLTPAQEERFLKSRSK